MDRTLPYWRLSAFYFCYYACLGSWIPYWPLYLQHIGHGAIVIGVTGAVFHATRVIAPNIWAYLADRTQRRLGIIRLGCFAAFVAILGMLLGTEVWWLTLVLLVFSFFWSAVLPQFEVLTLGFLGHRSHDYGRIRLWGSWGYIVAVLAIGGFFSLFALSFFPILVAFILLLLWISSIAVPTPVQESHAPGPSFSAALMKPEVLAFLFCVILVQISFGPYYAFFSIHLSQLGYSSVEIGGIWSLAVMSEIVLMFSVRHLLSGLGVYRLLALTLLLTSMRWVILWREGDSLFWIILIQLLHAFSFGAFHACVIEQVRRFFPGRNHGRGQAIFSSIGYGLGSVIGAAMAGFLWDALGSQLFIISAVLCLVALASLIAAKQIWPTPQPVTRKTYSNG